MNQLSPLNARNLPAVRQRMFRMAGWNEKWKCVIFKCYSSEELITLITLHEDVPTWYSFHSWVDWSNADKFSCSRRKHIDAEVRTRDLCIQNRHSNHYTNCSQMRLICYDIRGSFNSTFQIHWLIELYGEMCHWFPQQFWWSIGLSWFLY